MDELRALLSKATHQQCEPIVSMIGSGFCRGPDEIPRGICWLYRNALSHFHREVFETGGEESYAEVLCNLLAKLGINASPRIGCEALEELLVRQYFLFFWQSLSDSQQKDLDVAVRQSLGATGNSRELIQVGGLAGLMITAKLSGFGVYLLASSALSTVSGAVGLTLPFGLYTSISNAISVALGPVGWVALGIFATWKLTGTNYQKLIPIALYIAYLRRELEERPNVMYGGILVSQEAMKNRGRRLL